MIQISDSLQMEEEDQLLQMQEDQESSMIRTSDTLQLEEEDQLLQMQEDQESSMIQTSDTLQLEEEDQLLQMQEDPESNMIQTSDSFHSEKEHQIVQVQVDPERQLQLIQELAIPPLKDGARIAEWEEEFRLAVGSGLTKNTNQREVLSLLPYFINRRRVETIVGKLAAEEDTLDSAFQVLRSLDDPDNSYICWKRGEVIDEYYYYNLLNQVKQTEQPITACQHLLAQLPDIIQKDAVRFFSELKHEDGMSVSNAALLLSKIKDLMSEKKIPLDIGCGIFQMRYNPPKDKKARENGMDDTNQRAQVLGMVKGVVAIFLALLDAAGDIGLGVEYLTFGVFGKMQEEISSAPIYGISGDLNLAFCAMTFSWIIAGAVFQTVMFVQWRRRKSDNFQVFPKVVRVLMYLTCPLSLSPVIIQSYLVYLSWRGRDVTRFLPLLLTLKFGEVIFEALPQLATNLAAAWIKNWKYDGRLGKPDPRVWTQYRKNDGRLGKPDASVSHRKYEDSAMTPLQIISIATSVIGLVVCFIKWITTNRRNQFIGAKCRSICSMVPIFLWIFSSMLTGTSGIMHIPTHGPTSIVKSKALLIASTALNILALIVVIVYVAFVMKRCARILCAVLHSLCVIGSIVVALVTDVTYTEVFQNNGNLFRYYRIVLIAASGMQLITGLVVFIRPSACCGCCEDAEDGSIADANMVFEVANEDGGDKGNDEETTDILEYVNGDDGDKEAVPFLDATNKDYGDKENDGGVIDILENAIEDDGNKIE